MKLSSKKDREPLPLKRIKELYRTYGLLVPSDIRSFSEVIIDELAAFASTGGEEASLADLNES